MTAISPQRIAMYTTTAPTPTLAECLKALRERAGLTQQELADHSGVSLRAVEAYEQGRRQPSWFRLVRLAKALGVPVQSFADCDEAAAERV
jgi:transcriptional regulator with XRE-family HTH domain